MNICKLIVVIIGGAYAYGAIQPFQYVHGNNSAVEWKNWLRTFEIFMLASRTKEMTDTDLCAKLLHYAGPKVQQVYASLKEEPQSFGPLAAGYVTAKAEYDRMIDKLNGFFAPKRNATYERHIFRRMKQAKGEKIDIFLMKLREQAELCEFGERSEEFLKDQLTEGCASTELRKKILKRSHHSLDEIIKDARIDEAVMEEQEVFKEAQAGASKLAEESVQKIDIKRPSDRSNTNARYEPNRFAKNADNTCHRCGFSGHHAADPKCPARGKECHKCGGRDHFARKCKSKPRYTANGTKPKPYSYGPPAKQQKVKDENVPVENVQLVCAQRQPCDDDDDSDDVFMVTTNDSEKGVRCQIGGIPTKAIIDSGSKCNLIAEETWTWMKTAGIVVENKTKRSDRSFSAYGGYKLEVLGMFDATLNMVNKYTTAKFYVIKGSGKTLIGRDTAEHLGVLKIAVEVNTIITDSAKGNVAGSSEFAKIKGVVVDIPIKSNVKPVIQPYRRVPIPVEKAVDKKIGELLNQGIIERVNGASKWISPLVVVPRANGDIMICVDMRRANEAIERENHPLPTFDDYLPQLAGAKVFTKIDIRNAFHQVTF